MGQRPSSRRGASRQGHHRARHRTTRAGYKCQTRPLLRRRFSFRAGGGQPAENGLHQRRIHGRRLERLAGRGFANGEGLAGRILSVGGRKLAGAEGFEPSPSSLTVRCPTSWTTPQRALPPRRGRGRASADWIGSAATSAAEGVYKIPRQYHAGRLRKIYAQQTKNLTCVPAFFTPSNASCVSRVESLGQFAEWSEFVAPK